MINKKHLTLILKIALTSVVLYFLGKQVSEHWDAIGEYDYSIINYGYLSLSVLCALAALVLMALGWRMIIRHFGHSVTVGEAFKISYLSNLGRYIPGKVWQVMGILYLTGQKGIPAETSGASFIVWQLFTIPAAFLAFVLSVQLEPSIMISQIAFLGETTTHLVTALVVMVCAVLLLYPKPILGLINVVLRRFSRPEVTFSMDKSVALQVFVVYFVVWIVYGAAFWLFMLAIAGETAPGLVASIGIFAIAYQIGYLFLFAPGGFGPREAVMATLLAGFLGPVALLAAGLARLWSILIEVIAALVALKIKM